ncbi:hypothetical protein A4G18_05050 [Pasteurellaceae bacterium Pebbles2]|nr:hypothetical protein [Pasteurellaceae bacterium Pebbles2]
MYKIQSDFSDVVNLFAGDGKDVTHRYRSFDFCYAHFHPTNPNRTDVQYGCYVLWSYLASWGMLRGSSFLLQKNPAFLKELVEYILEQDKAVWEIDADNYVEKAKTIISLYKEVKATIIKNNEQDKTLVTKIILGVFGILPAYDSFFCETFKGISKQYSDKYCGFSSVSEHSLEVIYHFYQAHQKDITELQKNLKVMNFDGTESNLHYSAAKIIDMYGFNKSFK